MWVVVCTNFFTCDYVVHKDAAVHAWDCETFQFIGKENRCDLCMLVLESFVDCQFVWIVTSNQSPDYDITFHIACYQEVILCICFDARYSMFVETVCFWNAISFDINKHQFSIQQPTKTNRVAFVDEIDWEWSHFQTRVKNIVSLCFILLELVQFLFLFDRTLEGNLAWGRVTWRVQFVKQYFAISSDEN